MLSCQLIRCSGSVLKERLSIADATQAADEFEKLDRKCELQQHLVEEVSNYATKVTKEKNKLYRQSQLLLDKFADQLAEVSIADLKEITEDETEEDMSSGEAGAASAEAGAQEDDRTTLLAQIDGFNTNHLFLSFIHLTFMALDVRLFCPRFRSHNNERVSSD